MSDYAIDNWMVAWEPGEPEAVKVGPWPNHSGWSCHLGQSAFTTGCCELARHDWPEDRQGDDDVHRHPYPHRPRRNRPPDRPSGISQDRRISPPHLIRYRRRGRHLPRGLSVVMTRFLTFLTPGRWCFLTFLTAWPKSRHFSDVSDISGVFGQWQAPFSDKSDCARRAESIFPLSLIPPAARLPRARKQICQKSGTHPPFDWRRKGP